MNNPRLMDNPQLMNNHANPTPITCPMCGHSYDPSGQAACQACPLAKGCQLVRCPACGFETVDPARSGLARLARRLFGKTPAPASSQTQTQERSK